MSTILNALKKLEQDALAAETEHPPALNIHLRQERQLWKEKNAWMAGSPPRLLLAVLPAFLLLGAFVVFALVTDRFQGEAPHTQKASMPPPMEPSPKEEKALPAETGPTKAAIVPVQKQIPPLPAPPAKPVTAPHRETAKPAVAEMTEMVEKTEIPKKAEITKRAEMPKMTEGSKAPPQPVPGRDAAMVEENQALDKELPLLGDGQLKINAISWSRQADERLAVINSTIVREGQTVEGFRLVRIMEGGVIVQRAGQKSRVEFRLR